MGDPLCLDQGSLETCPIQVDLEALKQLFQKIANESNPGSLLPLKCMKGGTKKVENPIHGELVGGKDHPRDRKLGKWWVGWVDRNIIIKGSGRFFMVGLPPTKPCEDEG